MSPVISNVRKILLSPFMSNVSRRFTTTEVPLGTASSTCAGETKANRGLVLGVYGNSEGETSRLTKTAEKYDLLTRGKLSNLLKIGPIPKLGQAKVVYNLEPEFSSVVICGLGQECAGYNENEDRDDRKESIRIASAVGVKKLQEHEVMKIYVEGFGHAESAAEGAGLGVWMYQELKNKNKQLHVPHIDLHGDCDWTGWHIGLQKAAAQNLARQLTDTPANLMTPTTFAQNTVEILCNSGVNVEVKVKGWAETQKMGAFLSVAKGSCEPPIFLEISYYGAPSDERPVVLIGSGVSFDSGGTCLKSSTDMRHMRGDMAGAACVVATARALAELQLPLNVRGLIPLCENMPGCSAMKPGDVVTAMNGKNILVENTDCEGRLLLADTLVYSEKYWPRFVVDVGTLTKDIKTTMGAAATGVFTNSDQLWKQIRMSGMHSGDRMWRMPLWHYFTRQVAENSTVDIKNVGRGIGGGACRAAAFLREFIPCGEWMHLDIFGVMRANGIDHQYLRKGMSGRPTRTLIEFISQLVCKRCP